MKKILLILCLALTFACGDSGSTGDSSGVGQTNAGCPAGRLKTTVDGICIVGSWAAQVDRPSGGWIFLEVDATAEQKKLIGEAVEAGLKQTIRAAQHHNPTWQVYANPANYGVVMIKKMATNQDGTPALLVSNIQTAGTVINAYGDGNHRGAEPVITLPMPEPWPAAGDAYWSYLQASARHEGEHVIEYMNDHNEFLKRAVREDIHPHWSLPAELSRGLVARSDASSCLAAVNDSVSPAVIER